MTTKPPRVFKAGSFWRFRYPGTLNYAAFLTRAAARQAALACVREVSEITTDNQEIHANG